MITLNEMLSQWESDSVIDRDNLDAAALKTPQLHSKYLSIFTSVQLARAKASNDLSLMRGLRFRFYRGELERSELAEHSWDQWQGVKPMKAEMDQYMEADPELSKLKMRLEYLQSMYAAVESIMGQLKARDWQIRNAISWRQFVAGN